MEKLKKFLSSKFAKRTYWTILNSFVGLGLVYFSGESLWYAPVVIALLNSISKELNNKLSE